MSMPTLYLPIELESEKHCNGCEFLDEWMNGDYYCHRDKMEKIFQVMYEKYYLNQKTLQRPDWCPLVER